ncbi:BRCT domain-containing protein, partial [Dacryopinax primogenitus]
MESFLFQDVKFTIHRSIKKEDVEKLMAALDANGATEAEVEREATHIITDSLEVGIDMETDGKRIHLVTPAWVTRCMALGIRQEERFYSPDPKMLFSGIVGCASDAFKRKKTVGTLEWLVYALRDGRLSNPREQLMHFPHPKGPCGNFATYEMTVTNYTGPARDYVKLLIEALGAKFTPTMSGSTTHVIAGYCPPNEKVSAKIERAEEWKIPVVNHLWLEDCFVDWKESPVS